MAQQKTPNLDLVLPYQSEAVEVNDINGNYTKIDTAYGNLSDHIENDLFYHDSRSSTTYSIPLAKLQLRHPYGSALVSAWRTLFLLFYSQTEVAISLITTTAQSPHTATVSVANDVITITFSSTIWDGITVIPL